MEEVKKTIDDLTTEINRKNKTIEDKTSQCNTKTGRHIYQDILKQLNETNEYLKAIWKIYTY